MENNFKPVFIFYLDLFSKDITKSFKLLIKNIKTWFFFKLLRHPDALKSELYLKIIFIFKI